MKRFFAFVSVLSCTLSIADDQQPSPFASFKESAEELTLASKKMLAATQALTHQCLRQVIHKTKDVQHRAKELLKPTSDHILEHSKERLHDLQKKIFRFFQRCIVRTKNAAQAFTAELPDDEIPQEQDNS